MSEGIDFPIDIPIDDGGVGDLVKALRDLEGTLKLVTTHETKVEKEVKKTTKAIGDQTKLAKEAKSGLDGMGGTLKAIAGMQAFQTVSQGVGMAKAAIDSALNVATQFLDKLSASQKSRGALKNVLGEVDGDQANRFIDAFASKTEFTRAQLRHFAGDLGRAGLAGEGLTRALAGGMDLAALSGKGEQGMQQFTEQILQIAGSGNVGEEIFKMLGRGVNGASAKDDFFGILAARTGKSITKLKEDLGKGKVSINESIEALNTLITKRTGKDLGTAGLDAGKGLGASLKNLRSIPEDLIDNLANSDVGAKIAGGLSKVTALFAPGGTFGNALGSGLSTVVDIGVKALDMLPGALATVAVYAGPVIDIGKSLWATIKALWPVVQPLAVGLGGLLFGALKGVAFAFQLVAGGVEIVAPLVAPLAAVIGGVAVAMGGLSAKAADVYSSFVGPIVNAQKAISGFVGNFYQIGTDLVLGFVNGIKDKISSAMDAVADMGTSVIGGLKDVLGIHSPSVVFAGFGQMTATGFTEGLDDSAAMISNSIRDTFTVPELPGLPELPSLPEVPDLGGAMGDAMAPAVSAVSGAADSVGSIGGGGFSAGGGVTVNLDFSVNVTEPGATPQEIMDTAKAVLPGFLQSALERLALGAPA